MSDLFRQRVEEAREALLAGEDETVDYLRSHSGVSDDPLQDIRDAIIVLEHMRIGPCEGKYDPAALSDVAQRRVTAIGYLYRAGEALLLAAVLPNEETPE